ncbi:MAG: hypothetical protein K2O45_03830 [Oscillospiraceae bacterium]|nr:hypothetical protein [Oscillospiraceae bacterium]
MDKKRMTYVTVGFGVLLLVVMVLLVWGGRRQSGEIVLPESQSDGSGMGEDSAVSRLNTVSINPETVGPAISVLNRPASYSRTQTVETFWSGGSGQSSAQVYVSGSRTRLDTALPDGSMRHTLVESGGDQPLIGVWYDDETEWARLVGGTLAADQAGRMLTYETVRDLPPENIAHAEYLEAFGGQCVYVETQPDAEGYLDRYWVSVASGLLVSAERLYEDQVVYRFTAGEPDVSPQEESLFLLPDGSTLTD